MANVSKVFFSNANIPVNTIPTNRIVSTFKIVGGPRLPGFYWLVRDDATGRYDILNLKPQYKGQLIYSNTIGDNVNSFTVIPYFARMFLAVHNTSVTDPNALKWVPIINYYATSYQDAATGNEWDPVGAYTCNPAYLCGEP